MGENSNSFDSSKNELVFEKHAIAKTPFVHIIHKEMGHALIIGNNIVTDWYPNDDEIVKVVESTNWEIMTSLIMMLIQKSEQYKEIERRSKKEKK